MLALMQTKGSQADLETREKRGDRVVLDPRDLVDLRVQVDNQEHQAGRVCLVRLVWME